MSEATCGTCPFWDELGDGPRGECRVSHPTFAWDRNDERWHAFPVTHEDDWCSEHSYLQSPSQGLMLTEAAVRRIVADEIARVAERTRQLARGQRW